MAKLLVVLALFAVIGVLPALPFADDSVILGSKLAEGFGRTLVTAALASLGLLYRRNTNVGFGVAAVLAAALVIAGQLYVRSHSQSATLRDELGSGSAAFVAAPDPEVPIAGVQAPAPRMEAPVDSGRIPTMGEFSDKIGIAVDKFAEVYSKNAFPGAQRYSRACKRAAVASPDILETDFCVAFDMSAILYSVVLEESTGAPTDAYFDERAGALEGQYARFPQAHSDRSSIIWNEVRGRLPASL